MSLQFSKMQGLGNDFMVIDAIHQSVILAPETIKKWADRHFGIGFDQLLVVEPATQAEVDFKYRIFNADGSEVQQCGNGARCFAQFVYDKGLTTKREITVETASGIIVLYVEENGWVRVNMGAPKFEPASLPFQVETESDHYQIEIKGEAFDIGAVSMGNPHAVLRVEDIDQAPVETYGAVIESHPLFPERVNVGFAEIVSPQEIKLRVFERGVGETLACGTGACAAMVVFRKRGEVGETVTVTLPGGQLRIAWSGQPDAPVWMSGPVCWVFDGTLDEALPC